MEPGSDFSGFVALQDAKIESQIMQKCVRESSNSIEGEVAHAFRRLRRLTQSSNGPGRRRRGPPSLEMKKSGTSVST